MELLKKSDSGVPGENSEDLAKSLQNNDTEVSSERIRELALSDFLTSAALILMELNELKARLSLELQAIRDDRKAQKKMSSESSWAN